MTKHLIENYKVPEYTVDTTDLSFNIQDDYVEVHATLAVRFIGGTPGNFTDLILDGDDTIDLLSLMMDYENVPYTVSNDKKTLTIKGYDIASDIFAIQIGAKLYPEKNTELAGLYSSSNVISTQCEPHGFRRIIYSIDRPDVMSKYTVKISADKKKYPVLLSNGNLLEANDDNVNVGRHNVIWQDPFPKPSYLFALVAGDLGFIEDKRFNASKQSDTILRIYASKDKTHLLEVAMASLKKAMGWDEKTFGLYYDLDLFNIVALDDFNMGAMENKGLNIFNSKYIMASPQTATDLDLELIMGVVGHEYFHNWTGNRTTLNKWFDLTLKEGLTVFRDQSFTMDEGSSRVMKRIKDVKDLKRAQFPEDSSALAHPIRPRSYIIMDNFYTSTVYNKGAEIIRIYHTVLGKTGFRRGMDRYFQNHDGQAVQCEDFFNAMYDANIDHAQEIGFINKDQYEQSMKALFNWYHQAGTPKVTIDYEWSAGSLNISLKQENAKCTEVNGTYDPVLIPCVISAFVRDAGNNDSCREILLNGKKEIVLHFHELNSQYTFKVGEPLSKNEVMVLSCMREFSAPVNVKCTREGKDHTLVDKLFLLNNDTDDFNRWEVSQEIGRKLLIDLYNNPAEIDDLKQFCEIMDGIMTNEKMDHLFKAFLLILPSLEEMIELIPNCDPFRLNNVRSSIYKCITTRSQEYINNQMNILMNTLSAKPYVHENNDIAMRELLAMYMFLLGHLENHSSRDAIVKYYSICDNMTDKTNIIKALSMLQDTQYVNNVLAQFISEFPTDSLMISKWLRFNSNIQSIDVLKTLETIYHSSPYFKKETPNHLYALVLAFTINPYFYYIAEDGSAPGYEYIEKSIIDIDVGNSSVSSRIAKAFSIQAKLSPKHKEKMLESVKRISSSKISNALKEVIDAILA